MQVGKTEIQQMADYVWATVLGFDVAPGEWEPGEVLTGQVGIHGAWEGQVFLECDRELARQAALAMFSNGAPTVADEELEDAVGELVNMIGGNIKSVLPGPSELSLPAIIAGSAPVPEGRTRSVSFLSRGRGFRVTLYKAHGHRGRP